MRGGSNQHVSSLLILTEGYLLRRITALITFLTVQIFFLISKLDIENFPLASIFFHAYRPFFFSFFNELGNQ